MKSKAKQVLDEIEAEGHQMIVGPVKGRILVKEIEQGRPRKILEVGTYVGYSAILMAEASAGAKVITIEADSESAKKAKENIKKAGLADRIEVKVGDAREVIPRINETFDFMFIDAAKEEYLAYLKAAEVKLETKSVVIADNVKVFESAMKDYLDYVRESGYYESKTVDVGTDALEISVKEK